MRKKSSGLSEIRAILEKNNIPAEPDPTVLAVAYTYGRRFSGLREYEVSRYFYAILYSLTHDEEIRKLIENRP